MSTNQFSNAVRWASWGLIAIPLAGCGGSGPSGLYVAKHPESPVALVEKFDFQSGGKVAVTAFGSTSVGEFVVGDDERIRVIMPEGHSVTLQPANGGCLLAASDPEMVAEAAKDGMDLNELGLYCRD